MKRETLYRLWCLCGVALAVLLAFSGCLWGRKPNPGGTQGELDRRLVTASNDLGFRLYAQLAKQGGESNIFISPTSIGLALAMTYNGAEGTTKEAMAKALGLEGMTLEEVNKANGQLLGLLRDPDPKVQLAAANSLWGRQGFTFNEGFMQRNQDIYGAEVSSLDFQAASSADTINNWVSEHTRGKIPTVVTPDALREALLLLINAIYFKGEWSVQFDKSQTQDGPFTRLDGTQKTMPMMRQKDEFQYLATEEFQALSLPYGNKAVSMYLFLPKAQAGLPDFIKGLTRENWDKWMEQFADSEGTIVLPRFKADYKTSLKQALCGLGMGVAFTEGADFSGMLPSDAQARIEGKPYLTDAIHKTMLEVNEEGTEAAAVTVIGVGITAVSREFNMVVDHPFFLAIGDNRTGALLFMGSIVDPQ